MASRFLLHAAFYLKAMLSQLSVPQSANAALALSTSQSSTCQPALPQNPAAVQRGGGGNGEQIQMEEKREREIKKKNEGGRNGL